MDFIDTIEALRQRLQTQKPNDVLLDVRTPEEFAQGHIPQAVNMDLSHPDFLNQISRLDPKKTYITFCRSGSRALMASGLLTQAGFQTINSRVGIVQWQQAGQPLSQ